MRYLGDDKLAKNETFVNKNGNMNIEKFIYLIYTNQLDEYIRYSKLETHQCPPRELISSKVQCFYCINDWEHCISQVKEYKTYYKVKNKKYIKKDLDKMKEELD